MKKISILLVVALMVAMLAGCQLFCDHDWQDATCEDPETCEECGKTRGELGDHDWQDATCEEPKTCDICGDTKGDPLDHEWEEATTEAPKTCTVCQTTEGEPLDTDARFKTSATSDLQGKWETEVTFDGDMLGIGDTDVSFSFVVNMELGNTGNMTVALDMGSWEIFFRELIGFAQEMLYAEYADMGMSPEEVDEMMLDMYGQTLDEMLEESLEAEIGFGEDELKMEGVYYVDDGRIFLGDSWDGEFDISGYTLEDGVLIIDELSDLGGFGVIEWTRVED